MTRTLIFGRRGYLAQTFRQSWPAQVVAITDADVTSPASVARAITELKPTLVINAAGKTHGQRFSNIDGCEESPLAKRQTNAVNVDGAKVVRDACARADLPLVHLGSGCVYDGFGAMPIAEEQRPNPQSWYAETKAVGDAAVAEYERALVIRLRMPFACDPHPRNLLSKLAGYDAVVDAPNSITDVATLLDVVAHLVRQQATGIYHVVNPGCITPFGLACLSDLIAKRHRDRTSLTPQELNARTLAPRSNCVLSTAKLEAAGVRLMPAAPLVRQYLSGIQWRAA